MKPLKLIVAATILATSLPAFAEDKSGMMEEKTEQQGTQMMGNQGTHMMGNQGTRMMGNQGTHMMGNQGTHMMDKETMWKQMQTQNAELDTLVATMNSAEGNEKVDAIAAVVNKLVEIHKEVSTRMMHRYKGAMGPGSHMKGMTSGKMMEGEMMEGETMGGGMMEQGKGTTKEEEHDH